MRSLFLIVFLFLSGACTTNLPELPETLDSSRDQGHDQNDTSIHHNADHGSESDSGSTDSNDAADGSDTSDLPPLLTPPPARAYSQGTCPTLTGGHTSETSLVEGFATGEHQRSFRLLVPENYDGTKELPVVFAWHWLSGDSELFVRDGQLVSAIEEMEFIVVVFEQLRLENGSKAYAFNWPFAEADGLEAELLFFDDVLSCLSEQFRINSKKIYGIGVSAGALWLARMLSTSRADHFAAVASLSGGLASYGNWEITYERTRRQFPALVLWGGPTDQLGIDFHVASSNLRDTLVENGHFVIACSHESGHTLPPIEAPNPGQTRFISMWQFMLDHDFDTEEGDSPYLESGQLPALYPEWCTIASSQ